MSCMRALPSKNVTKITYGPLEMVEGKQREKRNLRTPLTHTTPPPGCGSTFTLILRNSN